MMKEYKLYKDLIITGPLSTIILQFLSDMRFSGRKYRSEECYLKSIDETAKEMNCSENDLSQELVEKWIQKNDFESHKTWSNRIVIIRRLAKYMNARGYNAYTTPIIVSKKSTDFVPYIFTKKNCRDYLTQPIICRLTLIALIGQWFFLYLFVCCMGVDCEYLKLFI